MNLTNLAVKNAKPSDKIRRLFDGRGLYLEVSPSGGKWWRLKYRFGGKEKRLSLGVYPDISLQKARQRREDMRQMVSDGIDPGENRKAQKKATRSKESNSFEVIAREWFEKYSTNWAQESIRKGLRGLERDIFPWIGGLPVGEISSVKLLEVLRLIEGRGAIETAHRMLGTCGRIFRYAIATGRTENNPAINLRGALPPVKGGHFAAVTEPQKAGEILRTLDGYEGSLIVRCALRLAPLLFVRPGELRQAEWKDIDLEKGEWKYLVQKTKTLHIVPLSQQAIQILQEIKPLTGHGCYVFPSARTNTRPMSDNAPLAAMRRMGIPKEEMSVHGFRAMARTILDEVLGFRPDFIEHQLAHAVRDPNGRAYNRTAHLPERKEMMQKWADYLDELKKA